MQKQIIEQTNDEVENYFEQYNSLVKGRIAADNVSLVGDKIEKQLSEGNITIQHQRELSESSIKKISKQISIKKNEFNKDLILLKMSLSRSSYLLHRKQSNKNEVKSVRIRNRSKTEISTDEFEEYEKRKLSWSKRLKQLKGLKQSVIRKKQNQELKKSVLLKKLHEEEVEKQRQFSEQSKMQKLQKIKQRMKKLQDSRVQRMQKLKNSYVKSSQSLPRFKRMRYQFDRREIQYELQQKQKLMVQSLRKQQLSRLDNIKSHNKEYEKKIKEKRPKKQQSPQFLAKRQADFNREHNPEKESRIKESKQKIKNYDKKVNVIRQKMKMDPKIGKHIEIAKDRSKHPFKYHYLKTRKHLTDQQIYDSYSQFNFNSDPNQIGNSYLQQINMQNSALSKKQGKKSERRAKTDVSNSEQRKIYKDYLEESKKNSRKRAPDQIEQLMKQYGQKSKVIEVLQGRAQQHISRSMKKIQKLKQISSYQNTLRVQKQIDEQFLNSIKLKLKCFQLK